MPSIPVIKPIIQVIFIGADGYFIIVFFKVLVKVGSHPVREHKMGVYDLKDILLCFFKMLFVIKQVENTCLNSSVNIIGIIVFGDVVKSMVVPEIYAEVCSRINITQPDN